ncbi:MAG: hypothetical protein JJU05_03215 [Verrucomicrobia bacterium]|nr:hypothetical protein [Verrucomicrobiota bacterium]MCH8528434.1 hypothetical protein [Kiritimatiellia bacterium]
MDIKTLIFSNMIICAFFAIAFFIYSSEQKTFWGFRLWNLSALIMTLGLFAFILRGSKWVGFNIFTVNSFFILAAVIRLDAITRFLLDKKQKKYIYIIPLFVGFACLFFYHFEDRIVIRSIISSTAYCVFSLWLSWLLIRHAPAENTSLYYSAAGIIAFRCLIVLARAWFGHFSDGQGIFDDNIRTSFQLGVGMITEISQNVFFLMMNSKRAEANFTQAQSKLNATVTDLKKALSDVKTLQGILPICAHCKKIRDDQGDWQGIEKYVHDRSDAEFSHGICPECAKEHFPEINFTEGS